jgi:hypothetical protein
VIESLDWFGFGSVDYIGRFAKHYGWDAIGELGLGCVFIGVESKFAGDHGYDKRDEIDARVVFDKLHSMGIRTVGAWMCGWDFQNHTNMYEDLNYFVSLKPTYQQLTRVSPFPGTPLWEKLREDGRVRDVPWEDVHFWSGAQKNVALEAHETLNLTEYGYDLLYKTWGPSILRRLEVQMAGYDYCRRSENPLLRRHKALFFKRQCGILWTNLPALDRFAPNGVVRRRVRKADEQYRALFGEPTPIMRTLGGNMERLVAAFKVRAFFDPLNRHPKEEPCKKYHYDKNGRSGSAIPYTTEMSEPSKAMRTKMRRAEVTGAVLSASLKAVRFTRRSQSDPVIDDYLMERIQQGWLGFGF